MKILIILIYIFICHIPANAQDNSLFLKKNLIVKADTLPYRMLMPVNYNPSTKYPLIIFLHGAGERGNDNESQLVHGASLFLRDSVRNKYPALIIFPQCAKTDYWSKVNILRDTNTGTRKLTFPINQKPTVALGMVMKLINKVEDEFRIDKKRIYVGGLSMGGMGTFELASRMPKKFAAAITICGASNPLIAPKLVNTNWWIFHGEKDDVVNPQFSRDMASAISKRGGNVKLTLYPNANHNSWDSAFAEPQFMQWMFGNRK